MQSEALKCLHKMELVQPCTTWFFQQRSRIGGMYMVTNVFSSASAAVCCYHVNPKLMLTFRKHYFFFSVLIFLIELLIAIFLHDGIIRPYIGDLLVVMLIYCFVRSFFKLSVLNISLFSSHLNMIEMFSTTFKHMMTDLISENVSRNHLHIS